MARKEAKKNNNDLNDHKRKHDGCQTQKADKKGKTTSEGSRNKRPCVEYPQCQICKRKHLAECRYKTKGCFNCGEEGHLKKDYPKLRNQKKDKKLIPARFFALTRGEAETSNTVVSELPSGERMLSSSGVRSIVVKIEGRELPVDWIEIDLKDNDVILGMDWLAKHGATIDSKGKIVNFQTEGGGNFTYKGKVSQNRIPIVSDLKSQWLTSSDCSKFLANVVEKSQEMQLEPKHVHIVCEFSEVFPEDLPTLPPSREIEFKIDLSPMMKPISKAPYRMAPIQLKDLKIQL
ncbi:uncharacterized protein LOC133785758 [Humulus lupulus]|uniref:uncharacterized protein LOC133785758 n=1 Tax=Humulus lupulus TaxID=3486 RepID=UPI002B413BD8|nr:uncharacterized protein LOC133785758 [Humulus lupulus]